MKKKIMALFAVLVMALAVAGTAYAAWTSSVQINGTATVGTLDLRWYSFSVDSETSPSATITSSYSDTDHTISITLHNVYPGYRANLTLQTKNYGTLPLNFDTFQMTSCSSTPLAAWFKLGFYGPYPIFNVGPFDFNYYASLRTYAGWLIPAAAVSLQPGATGASPIQISVDPAMPSGFMGETLVVTFQLTAVPYLP